MILTTFLSYTIPLAVCLAVLWGVDHWSRRLPRSTRYYHLYHED